MSIRLDPRRVGTLKQLAAEANERPGDLVRHWVEERIDAARSGLPTPEAASSLGDRLDALVARVAALEATLRAGDEPLGGGAEAPAAEVAIPVEAPESPKVEAAACDDARGHGRAQGAGAEAPEAQAGRGQAKDGARVAP